MRNRKPQQSVLPGGRIIYNVAAEVRVARYNQGDYIKVEFESSDNGLPGEWMWVRVHRCDEERQLVFGTLDNEPLVNAEDLQLGQELAVSYSKIREHKQPWEFQKN